MTENQLAKILSTAPATLEVIAAEAAEAGKPISIQGIESEDALIIIRTASMERIAIGLEGIEALIAIGIQELMKDRD